MNSLKILVSAYACRPNEGSEPGVGWNTVRELVKHHKVWVLTRSDNRSAIESELNDHPTPGLNFIYCELPFWARWWKPTSPHHYYLWQLCAYWMACDYHREIQFDIAHHVTYVRYWMPSFLSLLPIPFVWGPVGGGEMIPGDFEQGFSLRGKVHEIVRDLSRFVGERDPFTRLTAKRSSLVRATTEDTAERIRYLGATDVQVLPAIALSKEDIEYLVQLPSSTSTPLRFISIGRLLHWKGFHLGLKAFAQANLINAEYWIVGQGPEQQRLQKLADDLNIGNRVHFLGWLSREQTLEKLGECSVLIHPSLHDSGGGVCMEAMAAGRPVICLDLGGPSQQVTQETGFKVAAKTPEQAISDMANAMSQIAQDSKLLEKMGKEGQRRVRENYTWEAKGKMMAQLYSSVLTTCSFQSN